MRGMARGYAAGDSRGPGWREFAGTLGQLQAGRQAGNGMACSRAKARLNWVSQGQRRGRCKVRRRAERVIRPTRAQTDYGQFTPMLEQAEETTGTKACMTLADAGYYSGSNLSERAGRGQGGLVTSSTMSESRYTCRSRRRRR